MVKTDTVVCPNCDGKLKHYDKVRRIVRTANRKSKWVLIERAVCIHCGKIHRVIPGFIIPYKQYEREIIIGVINGYITPETYGYEDYPCEMTMQRWKTQDDSQKLQPPL